MILTEPEFLACDVLVVGSGGAGLRAAIEAKLTGANVFLASKSPVGLGNNTAISKASVPAAGVGDKRDSPEIHIKDTLTSGRFINERALAEKICREAVNDVPGLEKYGVRFQKNGNEFIIRKVPGHSYGRHLSAGNRSRGADLTQPLKDYAAHNGIRFIERCFISRLFVNENGILATGISREGKFLAIQAGAVVLATGGYGQMYLQCDNAAGSTGDGVALAFNLGVPLRDMEFVQFYPTAISGGAYMIAYETFVANYGAPIKNKLGENIVRKYGLDDPLVMTRDKLSQAIMKEILEGRDIEGGLIMDISAIRDEDLDKRRAVLPESVMDKKEFIVTPTSHFSMGGITIDAECRTSVPGLFACGEVTGGAHGANRLAGNALAEIFVMGRIAGSNAAQFALSSLRGKQDTSAAAVEKKRLESLIGGQDDNHLKDLIKVFKETMWYNVGIIRNQAGLENALNKIDEIKSASTQIRVSDVKNLITLLEFNNMLLLAEVVAKSSLQRTETRGAHYREDYPEEDPRLCNSFFMRNEHGGTTVSLSNI
jgi:fumarate reductase (CoM/CoB) subunit A